MPTANTPRIPGLIETAKEAAAALESASRGIVDVAAEPITAVSKWVERNICSELWNAHAMRVFRLTLVSAGVLDRDEGRGTAIAEVATKFSEFIAEVAGGTESPTEWRGYRNGLEVAAKICAALSETASTYRFATF